MIGDREGYISGRGYAYLCKSIFVLFLLSYAILIESFDAFCGDELDDIDVNVRNMNRILLAFVLYRKTMHDCEKRNSHRVMWYN